MPEKTPTNPVRVLVADDEPEFARRAVSQLEELDCVRVVACAQDGREAIDLFRRLQPEIALVDFSMPGANGLEILRAIRLSGQTCLVIIWTLHDEPSIRDYCLGIGADHFFTKANDFDRVLEVVRMHGAGPKARSPGGAR